LNSTPKIVFSRSLQAAPWGKWPPAQIINSDAIAELKKLKSQEGKDMVLWGSISLAQSLMKENLIDEFHIRIVPIVLGKGKLLFEHTPEIKLELFDTKKYDAGLLLLQYKPVN
jgi:dihydrofolate reductase